MSTMHDLIKALGQHIGLNDLEMDEHGVCQLVFDQTDAVNMEEVPENHTLVISSVVGPLPAQNRHLIYRQLLEAHLFGADTQGATFSLDRPEGDLLLWRALPEEGLDAAELAETLERFVTQLRSWREALASGSPSEPQPGTSHLPPQHVVWG